MYKSYTADDYTKYFGLGDGYTIDGLLVSGGWKRESEANRIKSVLTELYPGHSVKNLPEGFLGEGLEITYKEKKLWFFTLYGGAMLSEVAHLASLMGGRKNILIGVAGGLQAGIKAGEIVLPTESKKDGTMSFMYDPDESAYVQSDASLRESLQGRLGGKVTDGKTATCQAMLGETWEDIQKWSDEGNVAVEMEAATLFAVSKHFNIPSAALLTIADNLIEQTTVIDAAFASVGEAIDSARTAAATAALEELIS